MTRARPVKRVRCGLLALAACLVLRTAHGEEPEQSPDQPDPAPVATAILDAAPKSSRWPESSVDPWLVADELASRGALPLARRWVESSVLRSAPALARYLSSPLANAASPRPVLRQAREFLNSGRPESAELALRAAVAAPGTVGACEVAWLRALAARRLDRPEAAARSAESAANEARSMGWLEREDEALLKAAGDAMRAHLLPFARTLHDRRVALLRPLGATSALATALGHLADAEDRAGDVTSADASLSEAVALREALGPPVKLATALANLGDVRAIRGRFLEALDAFERGRRVLAAAAALQPQTADGQEHLEASGTLRCKEASLLGDCGLTNEAEQAFAQAIDLATKAGDHETRSIAEANLGVVLLRAGDLEAAEEVMERATRYFESRRDSTLIAQSLANWAEVLSLRGKHDVAQALQQGALARAEEIGDGLAAARIRGALGTIVRRAGRASEALAYHRAAAAAAARFGTPIDEAEQWTGSASAHLDLGNPLSAIADASRAFEVFRGTTSGLGDTFGVALRDTVDELFEVGSMAAARLDDPATTSTFLENGRAAMLIAALGGRERLASVTLPPALVAEERAARDAETASLTELLEALRNGHVDPAVRARAREARRRTAAVVDRIQREQAAAAALTYPTPVTLETVRGALGAEDAFVWYGLFPRGVVAFVARPKGARVVRLATTEDAVTRAVETLVNGDGTDATAQALAALRALVVAPLALDGAVRRVVVCPAGALAYAPLGALFEGRTVAVAPSATALALLAREGTKRGQGILAVGDPAYGPMANGSAVQLMRGELRLTSLPATRDEALAVADGVPPLLGEQATEEGLRRALASKRSRLRALHLACHGLVDRQEPLHSSLALTAAGDDDGYLTGAEILRVRVDADLVVLSACTSGLGRVARGEGMLGLTRAFMFSGVPRIVASLWKVDDAATKALMLRFYAKWQPKDGTPPLSAAEALRDAQAFVRRQPRWDHPRYWAGWVLWGVLD